MKSRVSLAAWFVAASFAAAFGAEPGPPDTLAVRIVPMTFREPPERARRRADFSPLGGMNSALRNRSWTMPRITTGNCLTGCV